MYGHIFHHFERAEPATIEGFAGLPAATVSDAMGRHGAVAGGIRPIVGGVHIVGSALTVLCFPGDNLMVHKALTMVSPGDLLVIDDGGHDTATFGHKSALALRTRGGVGTVTAGSIRDVAELRRDRLPVFARSVSPRAPQKNTAGSINVPVQVGGIVICPGDIVVADDDGVVVVPRAEADRILRAARKRDRHEAETAEGFGQLPPEPSGKKADIDALLRGQVIEHFAPVTWPGPDLQRD